jgi:hypothetical protein
MSKQQTSTNSCGVCNRHNDHNDNVNTTAAWSTPDTGTNSGTAARADTAGQRLGHWPGMCMSMSS